MVVKGESSNGHEAIGGGARRRCGNDRIRSLQASAALLTFDHSADNGSITVSACDFEFGAFIDNVSMGSRGAGYGGTQTVSPASGSFTFSGGWADPGISVDGSRTIYLVEQADPNTVSDRIDFAWVRRAIPNEPAGTNILVTFLTDSAGPLAGVPGGTDPSNVFVEDGQTVSFAGSASLTGPQYLSGTVVTPAANGSSPSPAVSSFPDSAWPESGRFGACFLIYARAVSKTRFRGVFYIAPAISLDQ